MSSKETLEALAKRIRLSIEKSGFHHLSDDDFEMLCTQNKAIFSEEKKLLITNFATAFGLMVRVSADVNSVIFYNST